MTWYFMFSPHSTFTWTLVAQHWLILQMSIIAFLFFWEEALWEQTYLPMQTWAAELTRNQIRHCTAFGTSRLRRQVCAGLRCTGAVCRLCCTPEKHTEHLTLLLLVWRLQFAFWTRTQSRKIFIIRISWFIRKSLYSFLPHVVFCQYYWME